MTAIEGPLLGQLLALLSAVSFALANNMIMRTTRSGGDKGVMFSVLVTAAIACVLWLVLEAHEGGIPDTGDNLVAIGWFAAAGVLAMVFGRTLVFESIRRLGVTRSTAVKRLNPFFSVLLAALILNETIALGDLVGMAAIAVSFGLLIQDSLRRGGGVANSPPPAAYLLGVFAALAYSIAYIGRKLGLDLMQAPAFGTMVSALTGFMVFAGLAAMSRRYRANFTGMFRHLDRWIVGGAVMVSFGQILLFAALAYEKVSTVVMIASLEIFISIFLSLVVFRSEARPGIAVFGAAGLATAGVLLVAAN